MALLTALLLSVSAVVAVAPVASAEPFENGTTIAPLSTGVYSVASCYQDGKIYLAGGLPSPITDTLYIYDIATGETTRGAKMTHGTDYPYFAQMPDGRLFVYALTNGAPDRTSGRPTPTKSAPAATIVRQMTLDAINGTAPRK